MEEWLMTGIRIRLLLLPITLCITLQACEGSSHPTEAECQSTERAAKDFYHLITNRDVENLKFVYDEYAEGLSGYRVFGPNDRPMESMVIRNSDCSLQFFSDLVLE
jgi:hypothetical protein